MELQPFSQPWAEAWREALASSRELADAARGFHGKVAFVVGAGSPGDAGRAVAVEIADGRVVDAGAVPVPEAHNARFALAAEADVWTGILDGSLEPAGAVLSGKVRLLRGSLLTITPHLALARELLRAARRVNASGHGASADW